MLEPAIVWLPVTLYVAPSPSAKPSPPTVTVSFVSGVPSYFFESVALVSVTGRFVIFTVALPVAVSYPYSSAWNSTVYSPTFVYVGLSSVKFSLASLYLIVAPSMFAVATTPYAFPSYTCSTSAALTVRPVLL